MIVASGDVICQRLHENEAQELLLRIKKLGGVEHDAPWRISVADFAIPTSKKGRYSYEDKEEELELELL